MSQGKKNELRDWLLITLGVVIMAVGIYYFKFPNNFSTGGVTGLAVVLGHYIPAVTPGTFVTIFNVALLILGFLVFGRSFGIRTAYASLLLSLLLQLMEVLLPLDHPLTNQPLMELLFAVGLPAVGSAVLFNLDASSGGTDIVAMLLRKWTSLNIGFALLCSDIVITLEDFITRPLRRGATRLKGEGVYTHDGKTILLTVVSRHQAVLLRNFIHQQDPGAFMIITTSTEIIGKGFRSVS